MQEKDVQASNVKGKLILKIHWTSLLKTMKADIIKQVSFIRKNRHYQIRLLLLRAISGNWGFNRQGELVGNKVDITGLDSKDWKVHQMESLSTTMV